MADRPRRPLTAAQKLLRAAAHKRYMTTEKGHAAVRRYRRSEKGRARKQRALKNSGKVYRSRALAKRRAWLQAEKMERGCIDCGFRDHGAALDFDHVRGVKEFTISARLIGISLSRLRAEIEKCVVRCACCHRIKTTQTKSSKVIRDSKSEATYLRLKANRRRRLDWLNEEKLRRGCVDCGYRKSAVALEFDHVRGVKNFAISRGIERLPRTTVLLEIQKCEVRCTNCHRIKTFEQQQIERAKTGGSRLPKNEVLQFRQSRRKKRPAFAVAEPELQVEVPENTTLVDIEKFRERGPT